MKKSNNGKTITLEELHKKNRELWNKAKNREALKPKDDNFLSGHLKHSDDFFHPDNIFNKTRNFPVCPASANAATIGAEQIVFDDIGKPVGITESKKHREAAKLLLLSQSNTFQHRFLSQYGKKLLRKTDSAFNAKKDNDRDEEDIFEERQKRMMLFESFDKSSILENLSLLPDTWTIVQISGHDPLVTRFKKTKSSEPPASNPDLTFVRLSGGQTRVTRCSGPSSVNCVSILQDFKSIIDEHIYVNKNPNQKTDIKKYHEKRRDLSDRLKVLVKSIEDAWLGFEKAILLGSLAAESDRGKVESLIKSSIKTNLDPAELEFLTILISATPFLSGDQLLKGISSMLGNVSEDEMISLTKTARINLESLKKATRNPVILILDPEVQGLPWESLPLMRECRQPVSRVPSLPFLYSLWSAHTGTGASVVSSGVAQDSVFYVLNPDNNLPETEKRLEGALKSWASWEGIVGKAPEKQEIKTALQGKDAFVYCGHGSGSKYLSIDEIEKLRVRAVPVLLGCSSGQLRRLGRSVDPLGAAQSYLIAASPALLGFLWPITDRDVDSWTTIFLDHWLKETGEPKLLQAVADTRMDFEHFTNGAAVIVYGLPLKARRQ